MRPAFLGRKGCAYTPLSKLKLLLKREFMLFKLLLLLPFTERVVPIARLLLSCLQKT